MMTGIVLITNITLGIGVLLTYYFVLQRTTRSLNAIFTETMKLSAWCGDMMTWLSDTASNNKIGIDNQELTDKSFFFHHYHERIIKCQYTLEFLHKLMYGSGMIAVVYIIELLASRNSWGLLSALGLLLAFVLYKMYGVFSEVAQLQQEKFEAQPSIDGLVAQLSTNSPVSEIP